MNWSCVSKTERVTRLNVNENPTSLTPVVADRCERNNCNYLSQTTATAPTGCPESKAYMHLSTHPPLKTNQALATTNGVAATEGLVETGNGLLIIRMTHSHCTRVASPLGCSESRTEVSTCIRCLSAQISQPLTSDQERRTLYLAHFPQAFR